MLSIYRFVTGPIETNTYVVADEKQHCLIIDPSAGCRDVLKKIEADGLAIDAMVLTHAHFDHIMGIPEIIKKAGNVPVYLHPDDKPFITSGELNGSLFLGEQYDYSGETRDLIEGTQKIGSFTITVLHVPGHTPGGCALLIETWCFCGDSLFAGSIGRSDLPGGDGALLVTSIKKKLMTLPENTTICPGHGGRTTIAREKRSNPFLS